MSKHNPFPPMPAPDVAPGQGFVSATSVDTIAESVRRADREIDKSFARIKQANETIAREYQRIDTLIVCRNELGLDLHKVAPPDYDFREVTMVGIAPAPWGAPTFRFQRSNPLAFERHLVAEETAYAVKGKSDTGYDDGEF